MPTAYEGTDIISYLQSRYTIRLAVYHIAKRYLIFLASPPLLCYNEHDQFDRCLP